MSNRAPRPDESDAVPEAGSEMVLNSDYGPSAETSSRSAVQQGTPAEAATTPETISPTAADDTARVTGETSPFGFNPETVIIQPPAPPPAAPTGRIDENAVTKAQLAEQLAVSVRTIERWANEGVLPAPVRQGRGQMATLFQSDAALLYWQEQSEEARKERRHRQRHRRNLPQESLTRESQSRRNRGPGGRS